MTFAGEQLGSGYKSKSRKARAKVKRMTARAMRREAKRTDEPPKRKYKGYWD